MSILGWNIIFNCYDCHFHKVNGHEKEYEIEFLSKIFDNKGINIFGGKILADKQNKLSDYYWGINIWQQG